jgi:hypothetical protein
MKLEGSSIGYPDSSWLEQSFQCFDISAIADQSPAEVVLPMDIRIVQRFNCSADRLWEILKDPLFEQELRKGAQIDVTMLKNEEKAGILVEHMRVVSQKELPALMRSATGVDRMTYEQQLSTDIAKKITNWKVIPAFAQDKVSCSGSSKIIPTATGCERHISGELKVNVPFVGGKIEQVIVTELESGYSKAAEVINRWIGG